MRAVFPGFYQDYFTEILLPVTIEVCKDLPVQVWRPLTFQNCGVCVGIAGGDTNHLFSFSVREVCAWPGYSGLI